MGCSKQFMICSHHCFWSLVWPLECSGWLAGCISRPQTAFYGLDMQPASQPSHSKGHTWLQKKWCSQIMNCFLQPMYSFRIGGGALKDYLFTCCSTEKVSGLCETFLILRLKEWGKFTDFQERNNNKQQKFWEVFWCTSKGLGLSKTFLSHQKTPILGPNWPN